MQDVQKHRFVDAPPAWEEQNADLLRQGLDAAQAAVEAQAVAHAQRAAHFYAEAQAHALVLTQVGEQGGYRNRALALAQHAHQQVLDHSCALANAQSQAFAIALARSQWLWRAADYMIIDGQQSSPTSEADKQYQTAQVAALPPKREPMLLFLDMAIETDDDMSTSYCATSFSS
jgi:hypothetical protein